VVQVMLEKVITVARVRAVVANTVKAVAAVLVA
jgi:hypothetical protein